MGYGTGVLRAYHAIFWLRGLTVGIAGTSSLFIARQSGCPQHMLVAARGLGCTIGPATLSALIGKLMWSGNSEVGVALALLVKMACEAAIPMVTSPFFLYGAFFGVGLAMSMLDTFATTLMARIHKERCGSVLIAYDVLYGVGCMIAPFLTVADPAMAWYILAAFDFMLFAGIASKRLRRGKPRDWKLKIRACSVPLPAEAGAVAADSELQLPRPAPARVVRAGVAFTFMVQIAMTAVSCWGFTYAASVMGLPVRLAAMVPTAFYASCTSSRFLITPASRYFLPTTIMHFGTAVALISAMLFYFIDRRVAAALAAGATVETLMSYAPSLLACFAMMGAGFCPHYAMMIAAMQRHGDLGAHVHGWYGTSTSLGITMGMWLPGFFRLPHIELFGTFSLWLILNSQERDFPRRASRPRAEADSSRTAMAKEKLAWLTSYLRWGPTAATAIDA